MEGGGTKTILASDFAMAIVNLLDDMGVNLGFDFDQLQKITAFEDADKLLVNSSGEDKQITIKDAFRAFADVCLSTTTGRRDFIGGKNLGTSFTKEQAEAIQSGTFRGIFPGDFWEDRSNLSGGGNLYTVTDLDYITYDLYGSPNDFTGDYHGIMVMIGGNNTVSGSGFPKWPTSSSITAIRFGDLVDNVNYNNRVHDLRKFFEGQETVAKIQNRSWPLEASVINSDGGIGASSYRKTDVYIPSLSMITENLYPFETSGLHSISALSLVLGSMFPTLSWFKHRTAPHFFMKSVNQKDSETLPGDLGVPYRGRYKIMVSDNFKKNSIGYISRAENGPLYSFHYAYRSGTNATFSDVLEMIPMCEIRGTTMAPRKKI